jgi:adenylate cyclase
MIPGLGGPTGMLKLRTVIEGEEKIFPLVGEEVRLGRGSDNDVVLSDFSVSRRHAAARREPDGWFIYDLMSTNGVQLNGVSVKKGPLKPGDHLKVGTFEFDVTGELPPPPAPRPDPKAVGALSGISSATIVRPLADFTADYGLDPTPSGPGGESAVRADKRKALDAAYANKLFGFMTRLARMLITSDEVDEVLSRVMDIAFEALPVDRGFILLRDDSGEVIPEMARVKDRVEFRPTSEVPVSRTMLEAVMTERVALLTYDALSDQRLAGGDSIRIHQIRAAMCAPLWSGEKIIGVMQVDSPFHVGTFTEQDLDLLTALANYAAVAIERIRFARKAEFERQARARLERYHSPAVIEEVMRRGAQDAAQGTVVRQAEVTVFFADLVGFTAYSERAHPEEVADLLEGYFTQSVEAIFRHGGTLDKFIGDCVMAFFGAPVAQPDHALRAARAAIEVQQALRRWNAERAGRGQAEIYARIAINSGPVVVGDIGSDRRVDYTVLGNTVNVASRLEGSVAGPNEIAVGARTRELIGDALELVDLGEFGLKGLQQKIHAYRLVVP